MEGMKKLFKSFLLVLVVLSTCLFTSCIDYVQTLDFDDDGYHCYFKLAISKAILEMSGEDPEYILGDLEEVQKGLPNGCMVNEVNNDFDVGFEFYFDIDGFTNPYDAALFYPYLSDDETELMVPFTLGQNAEAFESFETGEEESQAIMDTYLTTTKCRFLISKNIVPEIKSACFYSDTEYLEIPFYDYGESYCLEIPLIYFNYRDEFDLSTIAVQF